MSVSHYVFIERFSLGPNYCLTMWGGLASLNLLKSWLGSACFHAFDAACSDFKNTFGLFMEKMHWASVVYCSHRSTRFMLVAVSDKEGYSPFSGFVMFKQNSWLTNKGWRRPESICALSKTSAEWRHKKQLKKYALQKQINVVHIASPSVHTPA